MAEIFIARPGVLRDVDKAALRKAGVVVVEANQEDVKFIRAEVEVSAGVLLRAALEALNTQIGQSACEQREAFCRLVASSLPEMKKPAQGAEVSNG